MTEIERLIVQADEWRMVHHVAKRPIEASAAAIRMHGLLDAYEALGGDCSLWRKSCGVLR